MRIPVLIVVLIVALTGAACSGSRHDPNEKYFLVATNVKLAYWQSAQSGVVRAARALGVQAEMTGPDTYDPQAEKQALASAIAKKPAGIMVSVSNPDVLKPEIDNAIAAGIPVITMDSDAPASKRLCFIGTNNYQAGLMGGRLLSKALGGKGNVVVFTLPGQINLQERLHGYRDAVGENSGIKFVQVVDMKGDPRISFDTTTEVLSKGKEKVDAFVCLESSSCPEVAEVVSRNKASKVIIAMDTHKDTLEAVQKGIIAATIGQKPFTMAYYGLQMLDDMRHSAPAPLDRNWAQDSFAPIPAFVDTGATLIDKSNVEDFLRARDAAANAK
jgi:ribose transport system substrate-binding protein